MSFVLPCPAKFFLIEIAISNIQLVINKVCLFWEKALFQSQAFEGQHTQHTTHTPNQNQTSSSFYCRWFIPRFLRGAYIGRRHHVDFLVLLTARQRVFRWSRWQLDWRRLQFTWTIVNCSKLWLRTWPHSWQGCWRPALRRTSWNDWSFRWNALWSYTRPIYPNWAWPGTNARQIQQSRLWHMPASVLWRPAFAPCWTSRSTSPIHRKIILPEVPRRILPKVFEARQYVGRSEWRDRPLLNLSKCLQKSMVPTLELLSLICFNKSIQSLFLHDQDFLMSQGKPACLPLLLRSCSNLHYWQNIWVQSAPIEQRSFICQST